MKGQEIKIKKRFCLELIENSFYITVLNKKNQWVNNMGAIIKDINNTFELVWEGNLI